MSDNEKYYYLKLKDNFFESDEMDVLENMANGYKYSNILLKLYLRSLKGGSKFMIRNWIPYVPLVVAHVTNHSVEDVEEAVKASENLGLIEISEMSRIISKEENLEQEFRYGTKKNV